MKVKVNNLKLLKKGGNVPKFLKPYGKLTYVGRAHGKHYARGEDGALYLLYDKNNLTQPVKKVADNGKIFTSRFMGSTRAIGPDNKVYSQSNGRTALLNYRIAESKAKQLPAKLKPYPTIRLSQDARRGTYYNKQLRDGRWYHDLGNGRIDVANSDGTNTAYYMGSNGKYILGTGPKLLSVGATETPQRPVNPRGNTNSVVNTNNATSNSSPTNITDQNWLTARNNAMTRGWGSYVYNGLTYAFKGDDLKNAQNNWRINRGRLNNESLGLLGIITSENKPVETMLPAITLADTDRVLAEVDANIKTNSPRLLLANDGIYGVLSALKNPGASVAGLSYAKLSGNKGVGEYNKQNTSPAFYDQITNWYANNRPTVDNYLNNTNYSQDLNLSVLNFLDRYKLYRPKYTFARNGSKLILRNK